MAAEEDAGGGVVNDGHDDGGVGAGKGEVGDAFAGGAVGAVFCGRGLGGGGANGCGQRCEIFGGASTFCARVDGERWLAALRAERVADVPVEEGPGLGVDGGFRGWKGHVHAAFNEF